MYRIILFVLIFIFNAKIELNGIEDTINNSSEIKPISEDDINTRKEQEYYATGDVCPISHKNIHNSSNTPICRIFGIRFLGKVINYTTDDLDYVCIIPNLNLTLMKLKTGDIYDADHPRNKYDCPSHLTEIEERVKAIRERRTAANYFRFDIWANVSSTDKCTGHSTQFTLNPTTSVRNLISNGKSRGIEQENFASGDICHISQEAIHKYPNTQICRIFRIRLLGKVINYTTDDLDYVYMIPNLNLTLMKYKMGDIYDADHPINKYDCPSHMTEIEASVKGIRKLSTSVNLFRINATKTGRNLLCNPKGIPQNNNDQNPHCAAPLDYKYYIIIFIFGFVFGVLFSYCVFWVYSKRHRNENPEHKDKTKSTSLESQNKLIKDNETQVETGGF